MPGLGPAVLPQVLLKESQVTSTACAANNASYKRMDVIIILLSLMKCKHFNFYGTDTPLLLLRRYLVLLLKLACLVS